jgi:hypothetical protein
MEREPQVFLKCSSIVTDTLKFSSNKVELQIVADYRLGNTSNLLSRSLRHLASKGGP